MMISFPTITSCVFAAFLFGGPDPEQHSYKPVPTPSKECSFSAWVSQGEVNMERNGQKVAVPLPSNEGWYRFQYYWGQDQAYLSNPWGTFWYTVPVRMGPIGFF